MPATQILTACTVAFGAVFVLLASLAVVMQLLVLLFPQRKSEVEPEIVAVISTTVSALMPGATVTRIEER